MPSLRTDLTEIVTGLALLGFPDVDRALAVRPDWLHHVGPDQYRRISQARMAGKLETVFGVAWDNGRHFLSSPDGLRGRVPFRVEWKGPHKPPGYERLPADLRVDHVYLISCKYGSNVLHNVSPAHLFDRRLSERRVTPTDWYGEVAAEAYQELYAACRAAVDVSLPSRIHQLERAHREVLKRSFKRSWPAEIGAVYEQFAWAVASASAERWRASLDSVHRREEMLWRLLRLEAAPYFVLGADAEGAPLRFRTETPWDFRDRHRLHNFDVWPDAAGQPLVRWRAAVDDRITEGHVEIRWSHGRFTGVPEAKVYLDTPHHRVAGYIPLE